MKAIEKVQVIAFILCGLAICLLLAKKYFNV